MPQKGTLRTSVQSGKFLFSFSEITLLIIQEKRILPLPRRLFSDSNRRCVCLKVERWVCNTIFSRVLRDSTPRFVGRSVGRSVCRSVGRLVGRSHFTFFMIFIFGPHCSCPNGLVTSNIAPARPHATSVAVYPALFFSIVHANF